MARNLKFFFDESGVPCARGPQSEKLLMSFLETDIQGDDHICHDLMEDLDAIESGAAEEREFTGTAHTVSMLTDGITIHCHALDDGETMDDHDAESGTKESAQTAAKFDKNSSSNPTSEVSNASTGSGSAGTETADGEKKAESNEYKTTLRHFREIVEDWEAFILDESDDLTDDDNIHV